jgi:hypothetical protein
MTTREEFLKWCELAVADFDKYQDFRLKRLKELERHDPKLAELESRGMDAYAETVKYILSRLDNRKYKLTN